jgi:peptide/nickel transport system substrate-binding protein
MTTLVPGPTDSSSFSYFRRESASAFLLPRRRTTALAMLLLLTGCHHSALPPSTFTVAIQASPNSLDPRLGTDAVSERLDGLLFDSLTRKDAQFRLQPWLATSWDRPDPLTLVFHLRPGVHFTDGRLLTSADCAWTIHSMLNGSLMTSKSGAFSSVSSIETPDPLTLTLHLTRPDASLLYNVSDGLFGVVPMGSGKDFGSHPVGSGPFRFVSAAQDNEVVVARNPAYWGGAPSPTLDRVRFAVVPDAVTVALELESGSTNLESNELTLDMVHALTGRHGIVTDIGNSSRVTYLNFNVARGPLADRRVRQAIAYAIDRPEIIRSAWRGQAELAWTLLPPGHWAAVPQAEGSNYPHDPARARALLDEAGYKPDSHGVRLNIEMKTSQDEATRLLAEILQQQLAAAGIHLTLRASEFGAFYADVTAGRFEMYSLNWIGSNEDPDIFRYAYASDRTPPRGGNRGHYSNPRVDALLAQAAATTDEPTRRAAYAQVQRILAIDLPSIPLWYPRNEVLHTPGLTGVVPPADGSYDYLRRAALR